MIKRIRVKNFKSLADFDLPLGMFTCLIGLNGAGKTTVFNLLTGVYKPNNGRVTLDGQNITGKSTINKGCLNIGIFDKLLEILES